MLRLSGSPLWSLTLDWWRWQIYSKLVIISESTSIFLFWSLVSFSNFTSSLIHVVMTLHWLIFSSALLLSDLICLLFQMRSRSPLCVSVCVYKWYVNVQPLLASNLDFSTLSEFLKLSLHQLVSPHHTGSAPILRYSYRISPRVGHVNASKFSTIWYCCLCLNTKIETSCGIIFCMKQPKTLLYCLQCFI